MPKHNELATCQFFQPSEDDLTVSCFVYEPYPFDCEDDEFLPCYSLMCVIGGEGAFSSCGYTYTLHKNDIVTIFPDTPFRYYGIKNFEFSYLQFNGKEAERIMRAIGGDRHSPVLRPKTDVVAKWKSAFQRAASPCGAWEAKALLYGLTCELAVQNNTLLEEPQISLGASVNRYIAAHYTDSDLSLKKISQLFHFSYDYLSSVLYKENGVSFIKYLTELRLTHASHVLISTKLSVREVAQAVGYTDQLYFSRLFKKRFDLTPSEYRIKKKHKRDPLFEDFYVLK